MMKKLKIGDKVRWLSSGGMLSGVIKNIDLSLNGHQELIPWLTIDCDAWRWVLGDEGTKLVSCNRDVRLCGTHDYLKRMKLEIV